MFLIIVFSVSTDDCYGVFVQLEDHTCPLHQIAYWPGIIVSETHLPYDSGLSRSFDLFSAVRASGLLVKSSERLEATG